MFHLYINNNKLFYNIINDYNNTFSKVKISISQIKSYIQIIYNNKFNLKPFKKNDDNKIKSKVIISISQIKNYIQIIYNNKFNHKQNYSYSNIYL